MTVFYDDFRDAPGTHALLIGVGSYPHLVGGSGDRFPEAMGMGQLTSPPYSVQALINWFGAVDGGFHNPQRPIRSLAALCSATGAFEWTNPWRADTRPAVRAASLAEAMTSVREWRARIDRHADNLAVFYFVGHGLAFGKDDIALLLEGFGGDPNNPLADAIDIDAMRIGLRGKSRSSSLCFLIDACRTPPTDGFTRAHGSSYRGNPVVTAGIGPGLAGKAAPIFFASGLAEAAYGMPGAPSVFTQGFLRSMRGLASRPAGANWEVTTSRLVEGVNRAVSAQLWDSMPQYCHSSDTGQEVVLHRIKHPPEALMKVFTSDPALMPVARLAHVAVPSGHRTERQPNALPWWVGLAPGQYAFEATVTTGTAGPMPLPSQSLYVMPPGTEVSL